MKLAASVVGLGMVVIVSFVAFSAFQGSETQENVEFSWIEFFDDPATMDLIPVGCLILVGLNSIIQPKNEPGEFAGEISDSLVTLTLYILEKAESISWMGSHWKLEDKGKSEFNKFCPSSPSSSEPEEAN